MGQRYSSDALEFIAKEYVFLCGDTLKAHDMGDEDLIAFCHEKIDQFNSVILKTEHYDELFEILNAQKDNATSAEPTVEFSEEQLDTALSFLRTGLIESRANDLIDLSKQHQIATNAGNTEEIITLETQLTDCCAWLNQEGTLMEVSQRIYTLSDQTTQPETAADFAPETAQAIAMAKSYIDTTKATLVANATAVQE